MVYPVDEKFSDYLNEVETSGSWLKKPISNIVTGDITQVKKHLLKLVKKDKESFRKDLNWDDGTETVEDIKLIDCRSLQAYGCYGKYKDYYCPHIFNRYYTATPLYESESLDNDGNIISSGSESESSIEKEYTYSILDVFEDLLDEKGIDIPSEDREGEEGEARLYGTEYYTLQERIMELLTKFRSEIDSNA